MFTTTKSDLIGELEKGKFKLKSRREMNQKGVGEGKEPVRTSDYHTES